MEICGHGCVEICGHGICRGLGTEVYRKKGEKWWKTCSEQVSGCVLPGSICMACSSAYVIYRLRVKWVHWMQATNQVLGT